jgi:hypothetical protein
MVGTYRSTTTLLTQSRRPNIDKPEQHYAGGEEHPKLQVNIKE